MPKTPAVFYHATLTKHLPDIQEQGLQPRIGRLSLMIDEPTERIYLFDSLENLDTALGNWFGEALEDVYGEDEPMTLLQIKCEHVTEPRPTFEQDETSFEWTTEHPILPEHIVLMDYEI